MIDRSRAHGVAEAWLIMNGLPRVYASSLAVLLLDTAIRNISEMNDATAEITDALAEDRRKQASEAVEDRKIRAEIVNFEQTRKELANG